MNHEEIIEALKNHEDPTDELDKTLSEIEAQVQEAKTPPPASVPEDMHSQILKLLSERPDSPPPSQILEWKERYGQSGVRVFAGERDEVYIFTHLTGKQWDKIQTLNEKLQSQPNAATSRKVRDAVLKSCVLWPKLDDQWLADSRAGLPDSLFTVIMMNSYFLSPQQAMALTTTL